MISTAPTTRPARVLHIGSRRIVRPLLGDEADFRQRFDWLRSEVAEQLADALTGGPDTQPFHLVCSTVLSKVASGRPAHASAFSDAIEERTGLRPSGLIQGYQCTSWGYALRFAARHTAHRWLLLSIVDADLHDMMTAGYEDVIGRIGFGVTTLSLDLSQPTETPRCDGPFANHGFIDLLHAVRAQHRQHGALPTFMPFLPEGLAGVARRMLGDSLGPNRHDHYGHTFGSDPWIGLAEWLQRERPDAERDVLLGAFAYDGYYTAGRVCVGPVTRVVLLPDLLPTPSLTEAAP